MRKALTLLILAALLGAYLAGYWPERQRRVELQGQFEETAARLVQAEAQLRLCKLEGQLLELIETVEDKNYGTAQGLASRFFDGVTAESSRQPEGVGRTALSAIMAQRDGVTASLTQADPQAAAVLGTALDALRRALGQPTRPAMPSAAPSPAEG